MNKEEILNKYINLIDKGYCSDCNELNCIDNFPHAKITQAIRKLQQKNEELQQENKQLKIQISAREEVCNRLESNWNKLKECIKECLEAIDTIQKLTGNAIENYTPRILTYRQILDKMQEMETQQKEFIKFLEDNYKETQDIWYIKILQKYKEIMGDDK